MPQPTGTRRVGEILNAFGPLWSGARAAIVTKVISDTNVECYVFLSQSDPVRQPYMEFRSTNDVYDKDRLGDPAASGSESWFEVQVQVGQA